MIFFLQFVSLDCPTQMLTLSLFFVKAWSRGVQFWLWRANMSIAPTCLNIPPWKILVILKTLITLV